MGEIVAEVSKYLLLNEQKQVVNAILYDGVSAYKIPNNYTLEPAVEGVFYNIGTYKQEDGLFYYKHSDGTFHLEKEQEEEIL